MQTEFIQYKEVIQTEMIQVTNYEHQNVESIITPNLMFINKPVLVKNKSYYRLIIWFDYKHLVNNIRFTKPLIIQDLQFDLKLRFNNNLENISNKDVETKKVLQLKFDQEQHRIINNQEEYLTYLIEEKHFVNNHLELVYNLKFLKSNFKQFLNPSGFGTNRGVIKINLETNKQDRIIKIPEVIVYLENDTWRKLHQVTYPILAKNYYVQSFDLDFINESNLTIFKIKVEVEKQKPVAIWHQEYLKEIIYDLESNLVTDDILVKRMELKADQKLDNYYQNKVLSYKVIQKHNLYEIMLTSQWSFDFNQNKVVANTLNWLIFNPNMTKNQWIELELLLNNKPFIQRVFIGQKSNFKLVYNALDIEYSFSKTFKLRNDLPLNYHDYQEWNDES